jgi:hypothetical protein
MDALFFTCPKTRHRISTGVETSVEGLRRSWSKTLRLRCPHCAEEHEVAVRETYLNEAIERMACVEKPSAGLATRSRSSAP